MAERSLKLLIAGDATGALRALGQTGNAADGVGKKFLTFGKVAAAGFASAGVAAVAFGKSAVEAAAESQKISKITEQLVKTTGGAAKISAEQVGELATALSNKTAIDDEAIQSASNLILTFKNVRNEVGAGNDIFNRATAAALDLSTVMGTDASGAAMQLAKALDNPIKGVTALQRSGVSFTAQQKEQIKTLVEQNRTLEAQKIILKEVESQVGGTAAAQATSAERARIAFGNLQEQLGTYLLPVVEDVSIFIAERLIPRLAELADTWGPKVSAAFKRIGEVSKPVFEWLKTNVPIIIAEVKTVVSNAVTEITGFWETHGKDIERHVKMAYETIKGLIEGQMTTIRGVIKTGLALIEGDWKLALEGLKQMILGYFNVYEVITRAAKYALKEAAKFLFSALVEGLQEQASNIYTFIRAIPEVLGMLFSRAKTWLVKAGEDVVDGLIRGMGNKKGDLLKAALNLADSVANPLKAFWKIRSPSRLFMEYGELLADGLIIGMDGKRPAVERAAVAMASAVSGPMAGEAARNGGKRLATELFTSMAGEAARNGHMVATPLFTSMAGEAARNGGKTVATPLFTSMAGEAARNGGKAVGEPLFAAMAGEAARNGATVYTPLAGAMAGEAARNGNQVAKPLFAAMAGEAARNGAQQIAGALRMRLEVEARNLGYDMGNAMSEEITGSLEEVIGKMTQRINRNIGGAIGGGGGGMGGGQVFAGGPGGGPTGGGPIDVEGLYGGFTGTMGDWAKNQLKELADWNRKWNPDPGTPQVRVFAPNPITGGTLTDAQGNGVYLDDAAAVREALGLLVPAMAAGGIVTGPTLAMIGEAGPEAIVPLNRAGGYGMGDVTVNVTGSVISERDLVESIRKALIVDQQRGKILIPTY